MSSSAFLSKKSFDDRLRPGTTLSQLAIEAMDLAKAILEADGELTPELEERLTINSNSLLRKIDSYAYVEETFQTLSDHFKAKADRFYKISKAYSTRISTLRDNIKKVMRELGKDEIGGNEYRYKLGKSAPRLIIENENAIPAEFKMIIQTTQIDKDKVKAALVNGFDVPGAHIEENGTLRVYEQTGKE